MRLLALSLILLSSSVRLASAFVHHRTGNANNHLLQARSQIRLPERGTSTRLSDTLEPLAEEGTWQAYLDDETTGLIYYFDTETGESIWEPPTSTFPAIQLPRKQQRLAEDLRKRYRQARQEEEGLVFSAEVAAAEEATAEPAASGLPSWIEGLVEIAEAPSAAPETAIVEETVEETPIKEQKEGWFGGFFGDKNGSDAKAEEQVDEKELTNGETLVENKSAPGFFAALGGIMESATSIPDSPVEVGKDPVEKKAKQTKPMQQKSFVKTKKEPAIIDTSPKPIKIEMGSHVLPHPAKIRWGGEDAVFTKGRTFGVFDGVSGADKLDGVPLYSRTLANEMKKTVGKEGESIKSMTKLLTDAANYADDSATGASTAIVASIGENGFLQALNVGDSLCMVVRDGKITAKTREISHYWECPYQLSDDSPDRPRDGTKLNVELIPGDLVIMGSDGIFDNVSDDMLLDLIGKAQRANPNQLAKRICDLSRKQSVDNQSVTPYGKQAQRRGDPTFKNGLGGKLDDASCVVVLCK